MKTAPRKGTYRLLAALRPGDVIELGTPFLFDPEEPLVWTCTQVDDLNTESPPRVCVHLRPHFRGVPLKAVRATLYPEAKTLLWEAA